MNAQPSTTCRRRFPTPTVIAGIIRQKTGQAANADPSHDPILDRAREVSDAEIEDIVAFLKTLTGKTLDYADLVAPASLPK